MVGWLIRVSIFTFLLPFGCSGYLAEDFQEFQFRVADKYEIGSSAVELDQELRKSGFKKGGPAFIPTPRHPEPLPTCYQKRLVYGFWAGGRRVVCVDMDTDQMITEIDIFQLVAGL